MYTASCPSCGGQVPFRSAASVLAVCEYCASTLLRDADSVRDIGKVGALLEDYSPIQIGTSGVYQGRTFTVIGRIQLRYEAGVWNEWALGFDDGGNGWLADASGQFTLTELQPASNARLPAFADLKPGLTFELGGAKFIAADIRSADCISWRGELPTRITQGWRARVADFRYARRFLTLDYSDGDTPQIYAGQALTLTQLRCQLLRDDSTIQDSTGKLRGQLAALDCPNCGSAIQYRVGITTNLVCASCHAHLDCAGERAEVLKTADEVALVATTLDLGDHGVIDGARYEIIGLLQAQSFDGEDGETWVEYLLFNPQRGFLWLVESSDRWDKVRVLDQWPVLDGGSATLDGNRYAREAGYGATVIYAAGAFNWRAAIGDRTRIVDYRHGKQGISVETSVDEMLWTESREISDQLVRQVFNKPVGAVSMLEDASRLSLRTAWIFTLLILLLNVPITFVTGEEGIEIMFWALLILWAPVWISRHFLKAET